MKKELLSGYILFGIGFVLKFFHIHYNVFAMLAGLLLLVGFYTFFGLRKTLHRGDLLSGFCSVAWLTALLFTAKYYPGTNMALAVAALLSVAVAYSQYLQRNFDFYLKAVAVSMLSCTALYALPTDRRYELMNIHFNLELARDFYSWDKYSWFLYNNGRFEDAKKASDKALEIIEMHGGLEKERARVWAHGQKIDARNWESYH